MLRCVGMLTKRKKSALLTQPHVEEGIGKTKHNFSDQCSQRGAGLNERFAKDELKCDRHPRNGQGGSSLAVDRFVVPDDPALKCPKVPGDLPNADQHTLWPWCWLDIAAQAVGPSSLIERVSDLQGA